MRDQEWSIANVAYDVPDALAARIWARDASAWGPGEDDPARRLGWLDLPFEMEPEAKALVDFARDVRAGGVDSTALLGMGGSSLAAEVFAATVSSEPGCRLEVCDSTHPARVRAQASSLAAHRTLFVVSSKSGGTVETMSLYSYYRALVDDGDRFIAITDPGTSLEELAGAEGFRAAFLNPPDIGGRFSALSLFGLVPAALTGADVAGLLEGARAMAGACRREGAGNPGLELGCALASLVRAGRDKLTFLIPDEWLSFGDWVEQLLAESTGKRGTGIVPVVREPYASPDEYGRDRAFVHLRVAGEHGRLGELAAALARRGDPVISIDADGSADALGAEMFRWEFATAAAGAVLGINAFDQPDVEAAKRAARAALEEAEDQSWREDDPGEPFEDAGPGELACLLVFAPQTGAAMATLGAARRRLVASRRVATSAGFGPRYLHSTGQLHKGGPPGTRALVVLDPPRDDVEVPGAGYGFARLVTAQAAGDARALRDAGRRVACTTWTRFEEWANS